MSYYPMKTDRAGLKYLQYYKSHNVYHPGIDFNWGTGNQDKGMPVFSPSWGVVEYVSSRLFNGGLGLYIVIYHPWEGVWTRYLHCDTSTVKIGQKVAPLQQIATVGNTGTSSSHLHFEVLTYDGLKWIKQWHRPYGRYPAGLPKKTVMEYWIDPIPWLDSLPKKRSVEKQEMEKRLNIARIKIVTAKGIRKVRLARAIEYLVMRLFGN